MAERTDQWLATNETVGDPAYDPPGPMSLHTMVEKLLSSTATLEHWSGYRESLRRWYGTLQSGVQDSTLGMKGQFNLTRVSNRIEKVANSGPSRIIREENQFTWRMSYDDIKRFADWLMAFNRLNCLPTSTWKLTIRLRLFSSFQRASTNAETLISMGSR